MTYDGEHPSITGLYGIEAGIPVQAVGIARHVEGEGPVTITLPGQDEWETITLGTVSMEAIRREIDHLRRVATADLGEWADATPPEGGDTPRQSQDLARRILSSPNGVNALAQYAWIADRTGTEVIQLPDVTMWRRCEECGRVFIPQRRVPARFCSAVCGNRARGRRHWRKTHARRTNDLIDVK